MVRSGVHSLIIPFSSVKKSILTSKGSVMYQPVVDPLLSKFISMRVNCLMVQYGQNYRWFITYLIRPAQLLHLNISKHFTFGINFTPL